MTTSSRRRGLAVVLALGLSLVAATAHADPSAADLESARELYREGKELRQKGDVRGALERFKAAHGYGQTPVTGLELGKTHLQLGELLEAREVFLSVARLKVAGDETDKSTSARTEAAELADQIRPRIPTLVIKVSGLAPDATLAVTVDGAAVPLVASEALRKVNPGDHAIVVRASGREETRAVTLAESETKEVAIGFNDASPKVVTAPVVGAPAPGPAPKRSIHVVTWVGLGVGLVGVAVGSITGVIALGKAGDVKDACQGLSCPSSARANVDDGRTLANVSTVGFAVGVAGLAAAAVGYFVLSPTKAASVRRWTPSWGGFDGHF